MLEKTLKWLVLLRILISLADSVEVAARAERKATTEGAAAVVGAGASSAG